MYESTTTNPFSMLFSTTTTVPSHNYQYQPYDEPFYDMYSSPYTSSSSTSSSPDPTVDCTLSLGTPSTRENNNNNTINKKSSKRSGGFCGWNNIMKPKQVSNNSPASNNKSCRGSGGGGGGDSLLARRCANCDTTSTPLWRNGPRGPKSLCNACGIRYKKEERRASAAVNTTISGAPVEHQYILNNSWAQHSPKYPYYSPASGNEFSFIDNNNHSDVDNGIPFLTWGLNVTDRPSFIHY